MTFLTVGLVSAKHFPACSEVRLPLTVQAGLLFQLRFDYLCWIPASCGLYYPTKPVGTVPASKGEFYGPLKMRLVEKDPWQRKAWFTPGASW